jgi:hypothetical protein
MNPPMKLDEAKCGFVKAFGHGSEKWKGRLIESFEDTVQEWLLEDVEDSHRKKSVDRRVIIDSKPQDANAVFMSNAGTVVKGCSRVVQRTSPGYIGDLSSEMNLLREHHRNSTIVEPNKNKQQTVSVEISTQCLLEAKEPNKKEETEEPIQDHMLTFSLPQTSNEPNGKRVSAVEQKTHLQDGETSMKNIGVNGRYQGGKIVAASTIGRTSYEARNLSGPPDSAVSQYLPSPTTLPVVDQHPESTSHEESSVPDVDEYTG